ncbi:MAG TPA: response regulator transcription factor [Polyangiaceae bacterium]|nr:response regulator transcription factor [Polyangiaceae bacterium]
MSRKIRIVLVDDHEIFREGFVALMRDVPDVEVVGEASDAVTAIDVIDRTGPDVVVLDVSLSASNGLEVARIVRAQWPSRKVLVLTMHDTEDFVEEALAAGATGYALKAQRSEEIVDAIRCVARGEPTLPRSSTRMRAAPPVGDAQLRLRFDTLSTRERSVFDLVIRGLSTDEVAQRLCISPKTVETHRTRINRKLDVHSTAALVRFAARCGWLSSGT